MATLKPILFVGCGGSGGKTLRVTRRAVERRLARAGWDGGVPAAWQFLHIDVPVGQEGSTDDYGPFLPDHEYVNLVQKGIDYDGVNGGLMAKLGNQVRDQPALLELASWRPNPTQVFIPIQDGAGQYRAVGRVIAMYNAKRVLDAVRKARSAITTNVAQAELAEVCRRLGAEPPAAIPAPEVILVSSLAGGTGAGCFIDVADIMRAELEADHIMAFLYTSDVFRDVSGNAGVAGNSLAALSELLSGYWSSDARKLEILTKQGIKASPVTAGGPTYPFLVGARNTSGVSLDNQREVYRAIGEALAMVTVSPQVQEELVNFCKANWQTQASDNADTLGLVPPSRGGIPGGRYGATSSIGYSRLGLGRDRFREYAVKRIVRDAAEFLSSGYQVAAQQFHPDQVLMPVEALAKMIEFYSERFLQECNLDERNHQGHENNQIIDELRPSSVAARWQAEVGAILGSIRDLPAANGAVWLSRIKMAADPRQRDFEVLVESALAESSTAWAAGITDTILGVTAGYVAEHGVPVAVGLIESTIKELRTVASQLVTEAAGHRANGANWMGRVGTYLPVGQNLQGNFHNMRDVVKEAVSPWYLEFEARLCEKSSSLMIELGDSVLHPLLATLRAAHTRLEGDLAVQANGQLPEVLEWPRENLVPEWIKPSEVEILLDDVSKYPAVFTSLVHLALGQDPAARTEGPIVAARRQVIAGGFENAGAIKTLRSLRQEDRLAGTGRIWSPRAAGGDGNPTQFKAELDVESLHRRAEAWIGRPGPFLDYVEESLADYLAEHDKKGLPIADHSARLQSFEGNFLAALEASKPLIEVDNSVYAATHHQPLSIREIMEPLPFPNNHPARTVAENILRARVGGVNLSSYFTGGLGVGSVGICSFISKPVHPVVFRSVVGPIATKWQEGAAAFWQWRRSRPLGESMPVMSDVRRAMIRGWYTARLLGQLRTADRQAPFSILDADGQWQRFPHPLLGSVPTEDGLDQLAAVFESLPLAFLAWGVRNEQGEVAAYRRLYHLGMSDLLNLAQFTYSRPNPDLQDWIATGIAAPGCAARLPDPMTSTARADAAESWAHARANEYRKLAEKQLSPASLATVGRGIDLAAEIAGELEIIADAVNLQASQSISE